ncbi:hypothetical protein GE061_000226 [Apolygus lucorum]|uniref:Uncharacterized protein n=1 Tax=Apolygus lucorum TaxID=248454 RepID=A0A8S9Y5N4_APOLU|nr:hypothetical protein GE061_000226 [Apolygus lucorum]
MGPHRGKGLIDFLVDHNPFNLTLPGLNYCGPGNDLKSQIARNISPTNPLDNACRAHDIAYENSKDSSVRRVADQKLLGAALERIKSSQSSFLEKVGAATVAAAMKGKMMLGGKLGRRKSGQLKRLQVRSMPALGRRKRRGGKRRSIPSRATLAKRGIVMPGAYVARRGELVLMRASNDYNLFKGGADNSASTLILDKISWVVPQVKLSDEERAKLYNSLTRDPTFFLPFRCHELHEYPQLPSSSKISWNVKVSTQIHKPRYLIVALYTKLRNEITGSMTLPSVTNLRNAKLYLNDEAFPLQDMQFDLKNGKVAELYEAYARFQNSFYDRDNSQPILNRGTFADHPIIVIDMSRQRESVKTGAVDVRLELESIDNFPANTICYALLFHDKIVSYGPLNGTSKNGPYYSEQDRAATFHNWPHTAPTPVDLARAGFYYTGRFDMCRCAYCNIEVGRCLTCTESTKP